MFHVSTRVQGRFFGLLEFQRLTPTLACCMQVESKFSASQAYGLDKSRFHFFESAFELVLGLASNLWGWMPWLWDFSAEVVSKAGLGSWGGDIPTSLTFVTLAMCLQVRLDTPCIMYTPECPS